MRHEPLPRRGVRWSMRDNEHPAFWPLAPLAWTLVWITLVLLHSFRPTGEVFCLCGGPRLQLPSAAFGSDEVRTAVVEVTRHGITLEGEMIGSPEELVEKLVDLRQRAATLGLSMQSVNVAADADLAVGAVKAVLASAAAAGLSRTHLLVWHRMDPSAPPAPYP